MLVKDIVVCSKNFPTACMVAQPGAHGVRIALPCWGLPASCMLTSMKRNHNQMFLKIPFIIAFSQILNQEKREIGLI